MKKVLRIVLMIVLFATNAHGRSFDRRQRCKKLGREYKCSAKHQLGSVCFHKKCRSRILRCERTDESKKPDWIGNRWIGNCTDKPAINKWDKPAKYKEIASWNCLGGSSTPVTDVAQFSFRRKLYIIASSHDAFYLYEIDHDKKPEYVQKVPVNGKSLEKLAMLSVAKKRLMLAAGKNMTTTMYHFPNKEMKRSASGKMHYKFGFEKTIPSHRLMSRSTTKYASDERFGTYRCETRRSKSGRVYFVLDKQINSRFRKHFSSKNRQDFRSKRDVVDGRCDIASGKNMELFFAVNSKKNISRGFSSYVDIVEVKDFNRSQRIPHENRITATAAFQQGKRASLYVTGDQHGKCSLFRKKFLKT